MKTIFLIGFMGSGKTSVAEEVASRLDIAYLDTDQQVVESTGLTIPEIFKEKGEAFFREKETEILRSMPTENAVIATGGGIIGKLENRRWMEEIGNVIFLETSWEEIVQRLGDDPSRPLWSGKDKKQLFKKRASVYADTADVVVSTDGKSPGKVAEEIIAEIGQHEKSAD